MIDLIANNKDFSVLDAATDRRYGMNDLRLPLEGMMGSTKRLAFLYLDPGIASIASYLSFLNTNAALVLLNAGLDLSLKERLETTYAPAFIYDASRDAVTGYELQEFKNKSLGLVVFRKHGQAVAVHDNCRLLLSTSGTTGSPKLAKLSNTNLVENARSIAAFLPIVPEDVVPLNLPLYYSYGLSVFHSNALAGGTVVCGLPDILQKKFWEMMERYRFTSIAGVPFIYEMLSRIGFLTKEYPSLRYISVAGGNLNQSVKQRFNAYCSSQGIAFYVMYGQTEATARIAYVPPEELEARITSIGKPIANGELSLDPDTGELLYKGPNVFGGYAKSQDDLSTWDGSDILRTGDLATRDADGFYYIKGRLKRFVKIFGNRVNLDEVEDFIKGMENTGILACMGVEDQFILVAHANKELNASKLKLELFNRFKIHQNSIKCWHLPELPLTSNGKPDYKRIVSAYMSANS